MPITVYFSGQIGNIFFATATLIAYAKKHGHTYYVPKLAKACKPTQMNLIPIASTSPRFPKRFQYREPKNENGDPFHHEIPYMDYAELEGYYQSPKYFDWCRDDILKAFNFPVNMQMGITAIHVRRGDCVNSPNFPIAPKEYYVNAIKYMQERGHNNFKIFSDDKSWVQQHFTSEEFGGANFTFSTNTKPVDDYIEIQNCENVITARSTFSLTAAWINTNPNKIVLVPTTRHQWWRSFNTDILSGTNFVEIDFENKTDEWSI